MHIDSGPPSGWWPDPTGRHQFRWWTGHEWSEHALTNGRPFTDQLSPANPSPLTPTAAPDRTRGGCLSAINKLAWWLYGGFWLFVAIYSAATAVEENEPRYLLLTSTASLNIFLYKLTGKTRGEINRQLKAKVKLKQRLPYLVCGAVAAGGIWLSLHFNDPNILGISMAVAAIGLIFAWVLG